MKLTTLTQMRVSEPQAKLQNRVAKEVSKTTPQMHLTLIVSEQGSIFGDTSRPHYAMNLAPFWEVG